MEHIVFEDGAKAPFKIALLIKTDALHKKFLDRYYVKPLMKLGYKRSDIIALSLKYVKGKALASASKEYLLNNVLPTCSRAQIETLICIDATYFKYLTKQVYAKTIASYAKVDMPGWEDSMKVVPMVSYKVFMYNPLEEAKIAVCLSALNYAVMGVPVSNSSSKVDIHYPDVINVKDALDSLLGEPQVAVDIEAFSLKYDEAGIGTISFSKDKSSAITFPVDYETVGTKPIKPTKYSLFVRELLKDFFLRYKGTLVYHRAQYDVVVLVYELFMKHDEDREGMLEGLYVLTHNMIDTLVLTYVCVNSASGNVLGLKDNTIEYSGNYAIDVKDITKFPIKTVLKYNGLDTANTMYLKEKYWLTMIKENQREVYDVQIEAIPILTQAHIEGMAMDMQAVKALDRDLSTRLRDAGSAIKNDVSIALYNYHLRVKEMLAVNLGLKSKVKPLSDFNHISFNPKSTSRKGDLLHNFYNLPVQSETAKGAPQTGKEQLEKLLTYVKERLKNGNTDN
jgi:DNA polymerase-1